MPENPEQPPRVAVIGAGTMGAGIAQVFARAGCRVTLWSRSESTLAAARATVPDDVRCTRSLAEALEGADVVSENVAEIVALKQDILATAEAAVAPECLLTTNTSSVPITLLGTALEHPGRFLGMHWFNPAPVMPLVELVAGAATDAADMTRAESLTRRLGKLPVVVRADVPGFVVNRIQYAVLREVLHLVESGVTSVEDADLAVRTTLAPRWAACGPLELMDLAGLDVVQQVSGILMPELSNSAEVPASVSKLVADGALGAKSGRGFYPWTPERTAQVKAHRDAVVSRLTAEGGGDDD
ncbi:3-hydroxyacyl-CoA dehydrogenase NAD-binding domain-containing protein [Streptomyces sp. NBC_01390]|uniref:3-hydroxyacyl-CoA dehydrogenase family protein n=1 Tax=Streptomyces sp. NBC_01390 TaxID=2903850 RepID=UPI00324F5963